MHPYFSSLIFLHDKVNIDFNVFFLQTDINIAFKNANNLYMSSLIDTTRFNI